MAPIMIPAAISIFRLTGFTFIVGLFNLIFPAMLPAVQLVNQFASSLIAQNIKNFR
jgi:hypothetical protein